jgi:hypothetical protein
MVDDDDVVAHDEVLVSAPRRIDLDERRGDVDHSHARRHQCSDAQREVDIIHPRHVSAGEDCLLNLRALLRGQVHAASSLALLSLALLTLSLTRGLTLLIGLALLITLLALWRLTCGLIMLRLALALLGLTLLGLTLLALALHALLALLALTLLRLALLTMLALLALTLLRLALLTMRALFALTLLRLACGLISLALSLATLLGLALLALLLLGLAGRLLAFLLPLTTLLGLTLLALILRATLCLPGVALLVGCSRRAAFRLRAALGGAAGFAARHVLG